MKKTYFSPEMEELVVKLPTLMAGSPVDCEGEAETDSETVCTSEANTCSDEEAD